MCILSSKVALKVLLLIISVTNPLRCSHALNVDVSVGFTLLSFNFHVFACSKQVPECSEWKSLMSCLSGIGEMKVSECNFVCEVAECQLSPILNSFVYHLTHWAGSIVPSDRFHTVTGTVN